MTQSEPTVFVVDDDSAVLKGLQLLIKSVGMNVEIYLSAQEFLDSYDPVRPGCLVLDIRMPAMSGLELQEMLQKKKIRIPIIIITGYGDVPVAVQAMKKGAVDLIEKPFSDQVLLDRIQNSIAEDIQARQKEAERKELESRLALLTPRERQVMQRTTVDINNTIREAISFVEAEARLKGITILQVEPSKEILTFLADPIEIEQVLLNLLFNALEAISDIPDGRREITIRVAIEKDDSVQVTVSDTGKGLPPEIIDKVFDPFFTTKPKGLGIGLSISRSIIKAHGGQLWAAPGSPNGATFGFTLPLKGVCYDSI